MKEERLPEVLGRAQVRVAGADVVARPTGLVASRDKPARELRPRLIPAVAVARSDPLGDRQALPGVRHPGIALTDGTLELTVKGDIIEVELHHNLQDSSVIENDATSAGPAASRARSSALAWIPSSGSGRPLYRSRFMGYGAALVRVPGLRFEVCDRARALSSVVDYCTSNAPDTAIGASASRQGDGSRGARRARPALMGSAAARKVGSARRGS